MSKIITAINAMISNEKLITDVIRGCGGNEIFFLYDKKHKWSLVKRTDNDMYTLHYYPGSQTLKELAAMPDEYWDEFSEIITYSTDELGTREAKASLIELYTILNEKLFGMDEVLDSIINSGDVPF